MLKPWREVAAPHEDVLKGTFQQAEFAADLWRVHEGTASREYQDAKLFFQRTFITEGMRLLLESVVKRLRGKGGDPIIQLQTAFGGGKTHTMLAVYHLAQGKTATADLSGIPPILDAAKITELPRAQIAVLDGQNLAPHQPVKHGRSTVRTLWGELAWQLGGESAFERVKDADQSGTSPGKKVLAEMITACSPCVILIDELVGYIRQFDEGSKLTGGTFDSNLSFIQALTEALKAVPNAVLLASLPESDREAGSQRGVTALRALEHYFARVQALWKPVATEEAFEIVRRRLFGSLPDRKEAEAVCRAFADFYVANASDFPQETLESTYFRRLVKAYPIHPEVFDRLYEDWSSLDNFQRTRGVLKFMAKVIYRLWSDGNNDLMIMPGSLPLSDPDVRNEAIYYLPQGWDPVVERDIDGSRSDPAEIENSDTRLGAVQACRRTTRTIFLGSAPSTPNQRIRGAEMGRILLGCMQPGQQPGLFRDALRRLTDRLHYLNASDNRFWFDTRPNLRKEMEERKRRFKEKEDIQPAVRDRLQKMFSGGGLFEGVHVFTGSSDVPDDWALRLVILPLSEHFAKGRDYPARETAAEFLQKRGDQPRQKQNRLLFLAPEADAVGRLREQARSFLAWKSIVTDIKDLKLNLDQFQARQASKDLDDAEDLFIRTIKETFKWILSPRQDAQPGKSVSRLEWEPVPINTGAKSLSAEIERALQTEGMLISEWAPTHLETVLRQWFWKDGQTTAGAVDTWRKTCCYLYLPRLRDENVFRRTIEAGIGTRDFFAIAFGNAGGEFKGFSFGKQTPLVFDESLLLIEPKAAETYEAGRKTTPDPDPGPGPGNGSMPPIVRPPPPPPPAPDRTMHRFYGTVEIDPVSPKVKFNQIVDEILIHLTSRHDTTVKITVEIHADSPSGFDEKLQRDLKVNCKELKFGQGDFEKE